MRLHISGMADIWREQVALTKRLLKESWLSNSIRCQRSPFLAGQNFLFARNYDQAIAHFQRSLELDSGFPAAHQYLPLAYVQKGMYEEALAKIRAAPEGASVNTTGMPGYVYAVSGRVSEAKKELEDLKGSEKPNT